MWGIMNMNQQHVNFGSKQKLLERSAKTLKGMIINVRHAVVSNHGDVLAKGYMLGFQKRITYEA